jgi:effector-binding domain-containing protein
MSISVEIREQSPLRLLVKAATCSHAEIGRAFGNALSQVRSCLSKSLAKVKSAPMAVYLNWRESDCDMAVGCEVDGHVELTEGCEWLDVPGGLHACATHLGPYETLRETHSAIRAWCTAEKMKLSGPCWESYPISPESEPDSSKWRTEVCYPVET